MRTGEELALMDRLYSQTITEADIFWNNLVTTSLLSLITPGDISYLNKIIVSPRFSGNIKLKLKKIDEVMKFRGFVKFAGGTNRIVYTHPYAPNAVFKVAKDSVGLNDNPAEYKNQNLLKPYCCKVFECSPCGTIASFEKVERIKSVDEFVSIADDYFYCLTHMIIGKYVMEDIGIKYFMNIGVRPGEGIGCGPVLLDFPYLFELDGSKLVCSSKDEQGNPCHGEVNYDAGFNQLICSKCYKVYRARDLAKPASMGGLVLESSKRKHPIRMTIKRGDDIIKNVYQGREQEFLSETDKRM